MHSHFSAFSFEIYGEIFNFEEENHSKQWESGCFFRNIIQKILVFFLVFPDLSLILFLSSDLDPSLILS